MAMGVMMSMIEVILILAVICFGAISAGLFESVMHDLSLLETRLDRIENHLYYLECKTFHNISVDNRTDEQETEEDQTIQG